MEATKPQQEAQTEKKKSRLSAKQLQLAKGAGIFFAIMILYFAYEFFMYQSTDNAQIQANTVMISPKVSGYLININVQENQKVKKGDVLAEVDPRDYQYILDQANGELSSFEAQMKNAEKNYRRLADLYKNSAVSQQQFDAAEATYRQMKSKYVALQSQVSEAQLNLDSTHLKAPSDGVVAKRSAEVGMYVATGTPLFGFVSSEDRWVIANFKETELKNIKPGQKTYISVDALGGKTFEGEVESISPSTGATFTLLPPDNATGNFTKVVQRVPVRIKFKNLNDSMIDELKAGLSVVVKIRI